MSKLLMFAHFCFLVSYVSESLISLKSNEECEWIAQVAHQKWATMSDSLRSLRGIERSWENCSGRSFLDKKQAIRSEIKWANSQPCLFCTLYLQNELLSAASEQCYFNQPPWSGSGYSKFDKHYDKIAKIILLQGQCKRFFCNFYFMYQTDL